MELPAKYLIVVLFGGFILSLHGLPMLGENSGETFSGEEYSSDNQTNTTELQNLYVIRAVVYEIGILTNVSSTEEDDSSDSNEEVDLSFFRQHHNGSVIDLSNIPAPLQTNISGQVITGIAPINFGSVAAPSNNETNASLVVLDNSVPIAIPNAVISVTSNYSTTNLGTQEDILSNLQPLIPHIFDNSTTK